MTSYLIYRPKSQIIRFEIIINNGEEVCMLDFNRVNYSINLFSNDLKILLSTDNYGNILTK